MDLTLKTKKQLASLIIILLFGSFVGLMLANYFYFKWFEISTVYWIIVFFVAVIVAILSSATLRIGSIGNRLKSAVKDVLARFPWSFASFLFSFVIFLLFRAQPQGAEALAQGGDIAGIPSASLLAGVLIPGLLVAYLVSAYSFGVGESWEVGAIIIALGLIISIMSGSLLVGTVVIVVGLVYLIEDSVG